jgi:hypothetical protein
MAYYEVTVDDENFKIDAPSIAYAGRYGRDAWRDKHRQKNQDESFRIPEPRTVVVFMERAVGANDTN